jgi:Asp-tRNA(Asn)/Glu-tRNA(Gln) amidotransferase A subunit family amidase
MASPPEAAVRPGPFTGLTLSAIAGRLRDGTTDPIELVEKALTAVDAVQELLNAFVTVDHEGALRAAALATQELARGVDRGALHGVPVAVKDLVDTAGLTTTMGSRHFAGYLPERDAEVVARLRAAGAIVVGKTTTHEFAYGPTGDRAANGACRNPHDPRRMAGGSSAGSAAAVAAGLVPLAVGTDTGGSVRMPAALCGVVGIRPTVGRIPADGVFPLSWSLDTVGVLAGTVADTAVGWDVLSGAAPGAGSSARPAPGPATLRVGLPAGDWFERLDGTVRRGLDRVVETLNGHGAKVVPVPVPDVEELHRLYVTVVSAEAVSIHHDRLAQAPDLFDPETLQRLRAVEKAPAWEYAGSLRRLGEVRAAAADRLAGLDLLVLATVPILAPPLGARDGEFGGGWTSARDALLAYNTPWSVLGLPAMSLPVPGSGAGGLPVGVQLVGRPGGDEDLLAAARTVESVITGHGAANEPGRDLG